MQAARTQQCLEPLPRRWLSDRALQGCQDGTSPCGRGAAPPACAGSPPGACLQRLTHLYDGVSGMVLPALHRATFDSGSCHPSCVLLSVEREVLRRAFSLAAAHLIWVIEFSTLTGFEPLYMSRKCRPSVLSKLRARYASSATQEQGKVRKFGVQAQQSVLVPCLQRGWFRMGKLSHLCF